MRNNQLQDEWPYLHYARFTGAGNALIWVYNYDIYYRQEVRATHAYRITHDAVAGVVYNGIPDWLYEGRSGKTFMKFELVIKYILVY